MSACVKFVGFWSAVHWDTSVDNWDTSEDS